MPTVTRTRGAGAAPAPKRTRDRPDVRRAMLVQAATRSIAKHGFAGTTIERICNEAGVSRGLINHHFGSKEELILQCFQQVCDEWADHAKPDAGGPDLSPEDTLRAAIDKYFDPVWFKPGYLSIWVGFWSVIPKSPELRKLNRAVHVADLKNFQTMIEVLARKRQLKLNARLQAIQLISLLDGLWLQRSLDPKSISADEARAACLSAVERLLK